MADFNKAFGLTMGHEGGFANNPNDKGGMTYKGIARNFHPDWVGWLTVDAALKQTKDVQFLNNLLGKDRELQLDVQDFYKREFWDVNRLDAFINQDIANELFDTGVNMYWKTGAKFLQEALNLTNMNGKAYQDITVDGIIGPVTVQLTNKHPRPKLLLAVLNALQGERYLNIMRNNPTQEEFAPSWFSRVNC